MTNKKVFFLKQKWHVSIRDFKKQKKLIFWIVTRVSARDYTVYGGGKTNNLLEMADAWNSESWSTVWNIYYIDFSRPLFSEIKQRCNKTRNWSLLHAWLVFCIEGISFDNLSLEK